MPLAVPKSLAGCIKAARLERKVLKCKVTKSGKNTHIEQPTHPHFNGGGFIRISFSMTRILDWDYWGIVGACNRWNKMRLPKKFKSNAK